MSSLDNVNLGTPMSQSPMDLQLHFLPSYPSDTEPLSVRLVRETPPDSIKFKILQMVVSSTDSLPINNVAKLLGSASNGGAGQVKSVIQNLINSDLIEEAELGVSVRATEEGLMTYEVLIEFHHQEKETIAAISHLCQQ